MEHEYIQDDEDKEEVANDMIEAMLDKLDDVLEVEKEEEKE